MFLKRLSVCTYLCVQDEHNDNLCIDDCLKALETTFQISPRTLKFDNVKYPFIKHKLQLYFLHNLSLSAFIKKIKRST